MKPPSLATRGQSGHPRLLSAPRCAAGKPSKRGPFDRLHAQAAGKFCNARLPTPDHVGSHHGLTPCRPNTVAHRIPAGTPESASPLGEGKSGGFLESLRVRPGGDDSVRASTGRRAGRGRRPYKRGRGRRVRGWLLHPGGGSTRSGGYTGPAHHERIGEDGRVGGADPAKDWTRRIGDCLGGLVAVGFVVRHGPPTDSGPAHHERVDRPLSERLGCCRLCGSTRSCERLRPGSPRTGAPPRQAWDRPLRPKSGQALPLAQGWLSTDRVRGPFAARGSWVSWLPLETLPLGTHKGHPYSGRADYKRGVGGSQAARSLGR